MGIKRKKYDLYENDVFMGSYTADEIANMCNIPRSTVMSYASSGARARRKYTFKPAGVEDIPLEELKKEWDVARLRLLEVGRA